MIVYCFIFIMLVMAVFLQYFHKKELAFFCFWTGFLSALYVNAFRDMIGGYDVYIYAEVYENSDYNGNVFKWEWGFYNLGRLIHFFSGNRYFYFAILATIIMFSYLIVAQKQKKRFNYYLVFFLIFCKLYFYSFVYLRQSLAIIFIWFGFLYYVNNQRLNGRLLSLIAGLFHISGLVSLSMFLKRSIFSRNTVFFLFISGFLLIFVSSTTQIFLILGRALENDKAIIHGENGSLFNFFYLIEAAILFLWLSIRFKVYNLESYKYQMVYNASTLYMFFLLLSVTNATAARFTWYFLIGPLMFIVHEIESRRKNSDLILLSVLLYFSLVFFRVMFVWDGGDFMPYKSIFNDEPRHGRWDFMEYRSK